MRATTIKQQIIKILVLGLVLSRIADQAFAKEIEFNIDGINDSDGKIYVQLFKGEDNYKNGKAEAASIVSPQNNQAKVSFNNLTAGEYALRFFHDENGNTTLETNLFGLPTEGYGFSNNAKPNFGPVSYDEIKFELKESDEQVTNHSTVIY